MQSSLILIAVAFAVAHSAHNLEEEYDFHKTLDTSGRYTLHWRFNLESNAIYFAVKVQTEGWVGFGVSPTGKMPGSDVVMGWVDSSGSHFNDRFASVRGLPSIDPQQNWFLTAAEQENGYTLLEFYRNLTTCDSQDLDITSGTTRVIWSWHSSDPVNGVFQRHEEMGTTSMAFLGGLPVPRSEPDDAAILPIHSDNVTIPSDKDTTYWCQIKRLKNFISEDQEIYIYKFAPNINNRTKQYVHHFIVYLCTSDITEEYDVDCYAGGNNRRLFSSCYNGAVFAAWAVGGETFNFPENVSLALNTSRTLLLEVHYDNPNLHSGIIDESGVDMYYSLMPPKIQAGTLAIGSTNIPTIIIPPNAESFTFDTLCPSVCLEHFMPPDGISIFASFFHTHLVGKGLVVQHIRNSVGQCGATEELEPVDKDLHYDFNYQVINHLPRTVHIERGDSLMLQCIYQTKNKRSGVTLGGLGTKNEMCLAFLYYYPKIDLPFCGHHLNHSLAYDDFIAEHLQHNATAIQLAKTSLHNRNLAGISESFNQIQWTNETINQFEASVRNAKHYQICFGEGNSNFQYYAEHLPTVNCSYEAYNQCTGYQPQSCCERLRDVSIPSSAPGSSGSLMLHIAMALLIVAVWIMHVM